MLAMAKERLAINLLRLTNSFIFFITLLGRGLYSLLSSMAFRILCLCLFSLNFLKGQDIKGVYVRTNWVENLNNIVGYTFSLTLLTDPANEVARPTVSLAFGDNTTGTLSLASSDLLANTTVKTYTG